LLLILFLFLFFVAVLGIKSRASFIVGKHSTLSLLSTFLIWKLTLWFSNLSYFLMNLFRVICFPLSTTLAASHRFWSRPLSLWFFLVSAQSLAHSKDPMWEKQSCPDSSPSLATYASHPPIKGVLRGKKKSHPVSEPQ
jgi:hypothetical protein